MAEKLTIGRRGSMRSCICKAWFGSNNINWKPRPMKRSSMSRSPTKCHRKFRASAIANLDSVAPNIKCLSTSRAMSRSTSMVSKPTASSTTSGLVVYSRPALLILKSHRIRWSGPNLKFLLAPKPRCVVKMRVPLPELHFRQPAPSVQIGLLGSAIKLRQPINLNCSSILKRDKSSRSRQLWKCHRNFPI